MTVTTKPSSPSSGLSHISNDNEDAGDEGSCCLSAITKDQAIFSNVFSIRTPLWGSPSFLNLQFTGEEMEIRWDSQCCNPKTCALNDPGVLSHSSIQHVVHVPYMHVAHSEHIGPPWAFMSLLQLSSQPEEKNPPISYLPVKAQLAAPRRSSSDGMATKLS